MNEKRDIRATSVSKREKMQRIADMIEDEFLEQDISQLSPKERVQFWLEVNKHNVPRATESGEKKESETSRGLSKGQMEVKAYFRRPEAS